MNEAYTNSAYSNSHLTSYVEQKTLSANPLELVALLYSKAIGEIREARVHLAAGEIALRSKAISKACDAIGELDGSLKMELGGDLAQRLRSLYRYCLVRLLDANLQQADEPLGEVQRLLSTLSEGWEAIARTPDSGSQPYSPPVSDCPAPAVHWEAGREASEQAHSWTL